MGAVSKSRRRGGSLCSSLLKLMCFMCSVDVAPVTLFILRSYRLCRTFWLAVVLTLLNLAVKLLMLCIPHRGLHQMGNLGFDGIRDQNKPGVFISDGKIPCLEGELDWMNSHGFSVCLCFCRVGVLFLKV